MPDTPENPYLRRYRSQSIHDDLRVAAERIVGASIEALDANFLFKHARIGRGVAHIRSLLDSVDPELINLAQIENMNGLANNLRGHIDAYANANDQNLLDAADTALNEIYNYIRFLPIVPPDRATAAAEEAVRNFTKLTIGVLEEAKKRNQALAETITAQGKGLAEQQAKIEEANRVIESQKARLDQAIANNQSTFSQSEADRAKQFLEQSISWEKSRQELIGAETESRKSSENDRLESNKKFVENLKTQADAVMNEMKRLETDTKRIFGVVGNTTQSGEYRNAADRDASAANWLRILALVLMGGMAVAAGSAFIYSLRHPEIDWKVFGFRLGTTIILAIPAVYAAQESAKHRDREQSNRRIHLELAAIDAYLELLPETKRHEIKAELTSKFFGREEKVVEGNSKETSHVLLKIIEEAMKNLTKPQK